MLPTISPSKALPRQSVRPVEVWAWAMYDFANSGYTTVVITALFSAYFVGVVAEGAAWATLAWTSALAVSYGLIVLSAPVVGAIADAYAWKKRLLALATGGCVATTAALYFAVPGAIAVAATMVIASNFFYGMGQNLIAAFLPELAGSRSMGRVSGWGWSFGYFGGLTSLAACLAWISHAKAQGATAAEFVPVCMLITAVLFAVAAVPTFVFLGERTPPQGGDPAHVAASAWARLRVSFKHARRFRDLSRFLVCTVFYQAGIQAVIALAAIYAQEAMLFSTQETLLLILVVNLTASVGAFAFGYLQDRIGHISSIVLTMLGWIMMVVIAWRAQDSTMFWVAANIAGVCMGASQSASRAVVGLLAPPSRVAEFFGLWGLATNLASIIGPLTYGAITCITAGDHRTAFLCTGCYFLMALGLVFGVRIGRGRRAALRAEREDRRAIPRLAPFRPE
ncbi:MAG: MFS transporter [Rhodocyclaceae bacterium]